MSSDESHNDKQRSPGKKVVEDLRMAGDLSQLPQQISWLFAAAVTVAGEAGTFVLHHEHQISVVLTWVFALASPITGLVIVFRSEHTRQWAAASWHRCRGSLMPVAVFTVTAGLVVLGAQTARSLAGRVFPAGCASPVDLRVLTAPENLTALRAVARTFTAAGDGHCGQVRVTVTSFGSLTSVRAGLQGDWYGTPGGGETIRGALQPDIIIPGSSAEVPYLADEHQPGVHLVDEGSIATSPMAVGLTEQAEDDVAPGLAGNPQPTLKELLTSARTNGVQTFLRASPDVSEIGALATADLYATKALGGTADQTEEALAGTTTPFGDSTSMLCGLRTRPVGDRVAVIAPEQVLADYVNGEALGDACPREVPPVPLTIHLPSDTHVLNYPFVHVTWVDQDSARRASQVERFRHWLGGGRLRSQDFRDSSGRARPDTYAGVKPFPRLPRARDRAFAPSATKRWLEEIVLRWRPQRVVLAVDRSGSMGIGRSEGGSPFTYAVQLARGAALSLIHDPDSGELDTFSEIGGKQRFVALTPARRPPDRTDMDAKLRGLTPSGSDIPLYTAIEKAARSSVAVILTDGGSQKGDTASAAKDLRKRLVGSVPPIVVLTGDERCDASEPIKALGHAVTCVDTVNDEVNDTIAAILDAARVTP